MIRTVLCPVDFTSVSEASLQLAIEMCRRTGARLVLEHNLESRPPSYLTVGWMWSEEHEGDARDKSEIAAERLQRLFEEIPDGIDCEAKLTRGPVDKSLLYLAENLPAELMVMATHGPSNMAHRSVTERLIIRAPCAVLATGEAYASGARPSAPDGADSSDQPVLVPYDYSEHSRACLRFALAMTEALPHRIELLHVVEPRISVQGEPEGLFDLEEDLERLQRVLPAGLEERISINVVPGLPSECILERAREIGALFVLMAAHGKSRLKRFLFGTTTLEVLHGSHCPIWFVPPPVCESAAWTAT
jgi:universal stress protein A